MIDPVEKEMEELLVKLTNIIKEHIDSDDEVGKQEGRELIESASDEVHMALFLFMEMALHLKPYESEFVYWYAKATYKESSMVDLQCDCNNCEDRDSCENHNSN